MNDNAQSPTEELLDETVPETNAETATEDASGEQQEAPAVEQTAEELQEIENKKLSRFQRQQARYEAELEKQRAEIEFLRKLAVGTTQPAVDVVDDSQEPKIEDFEGRSITEYIQARDRFLENKLISAAEQRARNAYAQEQHRARMEQKVNEAKKELTDWDEVMAAAQEDPVHPAQDTAEFIIDSDIGPKIGYYLAKNPDEHVRLNNMSSVKRVAELARLEDKLRTKPELVVPVKKVTAAPAKLSETKGRTTVSAMDPAAAARQGYAAWKVANEARKAAKK